MGSELQFLSSPFMQVLSTIIKFGMDSKFNKIQPGTEEWGALERLEKSK